MKKQQQNVDDMGVKQTGLLIKEPSITDFRTSAADVIERNPTGDWTSYLPTYEKQFSKFKFDTMSCATFSALNVVETTLNWFIKNDLIPKENLDGLTKLGFIDEEGKFNASDRFTAIMSGTTKEGNYFQSVWDSIRKDGILPEIDFPFGGETWNEYHDKKNVTEEMKTKAKEVFKYLSFVYSWVTFDNDANFSPDQINLCTKALKQAPLHIAIPVPGTHAIMLSRIGENDISTFDQYPPFEFTVQIQYPVHYAMLGNVDIVPIASAAPFKFTITLKKGNKGNEVYELQKFLIKKGLLDSKLITPTSQGIFGPATDTAVKKYQKANNLFVDGVVGPMTRKTINDEQTGSDPTKKKSLVEALIQVESGGNDKAIGDLHLIDKAYGCLQIRKPVCTDVNKALKTSYKAQDMLGNRSLSIQIFNAYMDLYATSKALGRPVTDQDRARIWNGGPSGWKRTSTKVYWDKVQKALAGKPSGDPMFIQKLTTANR